MLCSPSIAALLAGALASVTLAHKVKIISPQPGAQIQPGSTLTIAIQVEASLEACQHVVFGFGINSQISSHPKSLGNVFLGVLNGAKTLSTSAAQDMNYTVQVPSQAKFVNGLQASYSLVVSQYVFVGEFYTPECTVVSVPIKVSSGSVTPPTREHPSPSCGGGPCPDPPASGCNSVNCPHAPPQPPVLGGTPGTLPKVNPAGGGGDYTSDTTYTTQDNGSGAGKRDGSGTGSGGGSGTGNGGGNGGSAGGCIGQGCGTGQGNGAGGCTGQGCGTSKGNGTTSCTGQGCGSGKGNGAGGCTGQGCGSGKGNGTSSCTGQWCGGGVQSHIPGKVDPVSKPPAGNDSHPTTSTPGIFSPTPPIDTPTTTDTSGASSLGYVTQAAILTFITISTAVLV